MNICPKSSPALAFMNELWGRSGRIQTRGICRLQVPYRRQASWKFRGGNMSSVNFYGMRMLRHTAALAADGEPEPLLDTVRAMGDVP
jgi:hypothetical protein